MNILNHFLVMNIRLAVALQDVESLQKLLHEESNLLRFFRKTFSCLEGFFSLNAQ